MILKREQIFLNTGFKEDLAGKAVKNGYITIVEHVVKLLFQVLSTTVLARFISPDSYGLLSMVAVVTNFIAIFKDAGLSMATIQKNEISEKEVSNLFWINAFISLGLGAIVSLCAPVVALFYGRRELVAITLFSAFSLIISGFSIQHQALLKRHMQFGSVFIINVASYVLSTLLSILLALLHFEYWALVIGGAFQTILMMGLTLYYCRWLPKRYDKETKVGDMLKYGADLTAFDFINYFSRNLDNILIGKFCGSAALGLYSKAYSIVYLPVNNIRNPINSVAIPVMTRIKEEEVRFRKYFTMQVSILSILVIPLMTFVYFNAGDLIEFLFGPTWMEMEFVFKMLALTAIFQPVMGIRGSAMVALGKSKLYLKTGIIGAVFTVTSFIVGTPFGINGVAIAYFISFVLNQFVAIPLVFSNTFLKIRDMVEGLYPTVIATGMGAIANLLLQRVLGGVPLFFRLALNGLLLYGAFLVIMVIIPRGREQLMTILRKITLQRR